MTQPHTLEPLITREEIQARIETLAAEIAGWIGTDRQLVVVALLRGSFIFLADLVRELFLHDVRVCIDFMSVYSYGAETVSSGNVVIDRNVALPLDNRPVLVIDDILDTGLTLTRVAAELRAKTPSDLRLCVLLDKPSRRKVPMEADFVGFKIDNTFVVGYGLDYNQQYRELPHIARLMLGP